MRGNKMKEKNYISESNWFFSKHETLTTTENSTTYYKSKHFIGILNGLTSIVLLIGMVIST